MLMHWYDIQTDNDYQQDLGPQRGFGFTLGGLITRLKNATKFEIPVGYQDETGFHTGVKADEKEIQWPTTW